MRDKFNDEDMIIRRMQDEKDALKARAERAEAMVERLLVAGRDLLCVTDEDFPKVSERWISLVEEWEGKTIKETTNDQNDHIDLIEYCPFCDSETVINVARIEILEQIKGKTVCQNCGELLFVCSECTKNNCRNQPDCFELREEWKDD